MHSEATLGEHQAVSSLFLTTSWGAALIPKDAAALSSCVRASLAFGEFLAKLEGSETIVPDVDRVGRQILWGIKEVMRVRSGADTFVDFGVYEEIDYANDSTLTRAESLARLRELAASVVETMRPVSLNWVEYASVIELRDEYRRHQQVLSLVETPIAARLDALLQMVRLQLLFLANTFC